MRRTKKAIVSLSLLTPIIATVSCGSSETGLSKKEQERIKEFNDINGNANKKSSSVFLDELLNNETEQQWLGDVEIQKDTKNIKGAVSGWDNAIKFPRTDNVASRIWMGYPNHLWGDISENTLEPSLESEVGFMQKDLSHEVSTFVLNFMSLETPTRDVLTSAIKDSRGNGQIAFSLNNSYGGSDKEIAPIFSWGGPVLGLNSDVLSAEVMREWISFTKGTKTNSPFNELYDMKTNQIARYFEQPQYNFNPKALFMKLFGWRTNPNWFHSDGPHPKYIDSPQVMSKLITYIDEMKSYKNYSLYKKIATEGKINNYAALKLMSGNIDLKPSELFEVTSTALAIISAQKKEILFEQWKQQRDIVWIGGSYGNDELMQSILLDNDILYKSKAVVLWGNFLRNAIEGSSSLSGGIVTSQDYNNQIKNSSISWTDSSISFAVNYIKMKYGFINRLKEKFESDQKFKNEFLSKVHIYIGKDDKTVGSISNYEKDFYDKYHIDYHIKDGGHTPDIVDKGDDFWKNVLHMERPKESFVDYTGSAKYQLKKP